MRLLQRDFEVETRYGGNFVQEIDGVAGGREGGRRVDWFYYVNGIESGVGRGRAARASRATGSGGTTTTGAPRCASRPWSAPSPSRSSPAARAASCRSGIVCLGDADAAVRRGRDAARATRASPTRARSVLEQSAGREVLRVLVGPWSQVRRDTAARKLEGGPAESGRVRPAHAGRRPDRPARRRTARVERTLGPGGGLLAATRIEAQQPTWIVTGVDAAGVAAAAAALTEEELQDHFAIAVEEGRTVPLPVAGPGQAP